MVAAVEATAQTLQEMIGLEPPMNIVLVGGVLLVLVLALLAVVRALRRYRQSAGQRFQTLVEESDSIGILLHPNPDPDAMAAGVGVSTLAEAVDTETTIYFPGEIRHQENRAFRTILDLDLTVVESRENIESDEIVLVDHNEARGFEGASALTPMAVVDHHPGSGSGRAFTDVRPEYGASATIIAEYLQSNGFTPVGPEEEVGDRKEVIPAAISTGLLYGILSDTDHLTNGCSPAEFRMTEFLYPGTDSELLNRIASPQMDAEILDVKAAAIREREVNGPFAVSHIGAVENVDAIPQAADELLRLEGVTAVVVGGTKNGTLHLSGRSRDDRVHMGKALERAVEDIPQSSAGGHARMGGGQISLPHMEGLGPGSGISIGEFTDRLFRSMNGEEVLEAS